jgi:hypothetical protein
MRAIILAIISLSVSIPTFAAPTLKVDANPKIDSSIQDKGPEVKMIWSGHAANQNSLHQVLEKEVETGKWTPQAHNKMDIAIQVLSKKISDKEWELKFEKIKNKMNMAVSGQKPKSNNWSVEKHLLGKKIRVKFDEQGNISYPNIDALRADLYKIKNSEERSAALGVLDPKTLSSFAQALSPKSVPYSGTCLEKLPGKNIGDKWAVTVNVAELKDVTFNCEFKGWAKMGKEKLAVIAYTAKAEATKDHPIRDGQPTQDGEPPMTVITVAEFSGSTYYLPSSGENLSVQAADITTTALGANKLRSHVTSKVNNHFWSL